MFRLAEGFDFHPISISTSLPDGLKWRGGGKWCYEEKYDGVRAVIGGGKCFGRSRLLPFQVPASLNNCCLDGELVGNAFYAFDIPIIDGQDIRQEPLHFRRQALSALLSDGEFVNVRPVSCGQGGEFLEAVLARGGEGVVAKHLSSRYGESESWIKCKRQETHDLIVTEIHPSKMSVKLGDSGWCPVLSEERLSAIRIGSMIEVSCHSITAGGKLREPRFIRIRTDK